MLTDLTLNPSATASRSTTLSVVWEANYFHSPLAPQPSLFPLFKHLPFLFHAQSVDVLASYFKVGGGARPKYPTRAHSHPIPYQPWVLLSQALWGLSIHSLPVSHAQGLHSSNSPLCPLDCCHQVNMLLIPPLKKQKTRKPSRLCFPLHLPPITLFQLTALKTLQKTSLFCLHSSLVM